MHLDRQVVAADELIVALSLLELETVELAGARSHARRSLKVEPISLRNLIGPTEIELGCKRQVAKRATQLEMERASLLTNIDDDVRTIDDLEFPHIGFPKAVFDAAGTRDGIGIVSVAVALLAVRGGRCDQQSYEEDAESHDCTPGP